METQLKRLVMLVFVMSGLWVMVVCLILGAFFFLVKAVLIALTPLVGAGFAYISGGVLCAIPAVVALFLLRADTAKPHDPEKQAKEKQIKIGPVDMRHITLLVREYPFEAAMLAFALGFSRESAVDLQHLVSAASRHAHGE